MLNADLSGFIKLLNMPSKNDLEKYCRDYVLGWEELATAIELAMMNGFAPYRYANTFRDWSPEHLALTDNDLGALSSNGIGPLTKGAKKTMNKAFQMIQDRRHLAAHLLYTEDRAYWFLFYFDQRDMSADNNHWMYGPHIHLISHHWPNLRLDDVWQRVESGEVNFPSKIHLRCKRPLNRLQARIP